jgi:hypothetical protein
MSGYCKTKSDPTSALCQKSLLLGIGPARGISMQNAQLRRLRFSKSLSHVFIPFRLASPTISTDPEKSGKQHCYRSSVQLLGTELSEYGFEWDEERTKHLNKPVIKLLKPAKWQKFSSFSAILFPTSEAVTGKSLFDRG